MCNLTIATLRCAALCCAAAPLRHATQDPLHGPKSQVLPKLCSSCKPPALSATVEPKDLFEPLHAIKIRTYSVVRYPVRKENIETMSIRHRSRFDTEVHSTTKSIRRRSRFDNEVDSTPKSALIITCTFCLKIERGAA